MKKNTYKTKVVFRKYAGGDVMALFPEESFKLTYTTTFYQRIGQHGDCNYHAVIDMTKLAKPEEYKDLKTELESLGYDLIVRQKASISYK